MKYGGQIIATTKTSAGTLITETTKVAKRNTLRLAQRFANQNNRELHFENLDMAFYYDFNSFMSQQGLNGNNRGKHFKEIKALLREANERDIKVNWLIKRKAGE